MKVAIVMGSSSDFPTLEPAVETLRDFGVECEVRVVSAHRTPEEMIAFGLSAADDGISVIIAAAGGAAHLPGMLASVTRLPVIGVPVPITALDGMDALLSIVQMPAGIPVATMAIGGAVNAALMAVRILALSNRDLQVKLAEHRQSLQAKAHDGDEEVQRRARSARPD
jgi:5-(carboxyamino)imidazole ribonucleotide mutase